MSYTTMVATLNDALDAMTSTLPAGYSIGYACADPTNAANLVRADAERKAQERAVGGDDAVPADGSDAATCHVLFEVRGPNGARAVDWQAVADVQAGDALDVCDWLAALLTTCEGRAGG